MLDVSQLSDNDFLEFARLFGRGNMNLKDYIQLRDSVKTRCNNMGYAWQQGCCGTNNIIKIENAKKK